jgi:hypothetical protein
MRMDDKKFVDKLISESTNTKIDAGSNDPYYNEIAKAFAEKIAEESERKG